MGSTGIVARGAGGVADAAMGPAGLPEQSVEKGRTWDLAYPAHSSRDLRIDFFRGWVMMVLIVIHLDFFSWYNLLIWERIGVISGGEGFVILSGLVLGMVSRKRLEREGFRAAASRLVDRASQLYRVNLAVILLVALFGFLPLIDASAVQTYIDRAGGKVYPLYPGEKASLAYWLGSIALLKVGPHQFQIMGLYVILVGLTPLALWMMAKKRTGLLLALCWILYVKNWAFPARPTGAMFEYAFPLLTWQLTYFHGLAVGFHKEKIQEVLARGWLRPLLAVCVGLGLAFLLFSQNNPNPAMPEWARWSYIPEDLFRKIYRGYMLKSKLGILRILNYFCFLVVGYWLLTRYWKVFYRSVGWWFVPVGQASLYVFIVHVFWVMLLGNISIFWQGNPWINTLGHTLVLAMVWLMVKARFLFRWIPR